MELRIAGTISESVVDGPGYRFVVFTQGCRHCCPGCHNQHTWDPAGGTAVRVVDLLERIKTAKLLKGITLTGGEPFLQATPLAWLGREVKKLGLDVITYTGYTWEELMLISLNKKDIKELLLVSDYLVDGLFILAERELELPFRGSSNQRILDVSQSLQAGGPVEAYFS
ncbi:MAG: 4Fe-4S single cluster domain-containing protein [Desulfotomaculaceae bacterium]|nr:4Fe-4S single cluster domain-containing protein [Desulfotomaculaceae bacterium]